MTALDHKMTLASILPVLKTTKLCIRRKGSNPNYLIYLHRDGSFRYWSTYVTPKEGYEKFNIQDFESQDWMVVSAPDATNFSFYCDRD